MVVDGELDAYFADRSILLGLVMTSENPDELVVGERLFTRHRQEPARVDRAHVVDEGETLAGVHVDGHQRFGQVDDQIATRL